VYKAFGGDNLVKKVGILYHPHNQRALTLAKKLVQFLEAREVPCWLCSAWEGDGAREQIAGTDLIVTTGGDGTILRAAQVVALGAVPIIGINLGKLGFMTELEAGEAEEKLPALLAGEGWIDERAMIEAEVNSGDGVTSRLYSVNDVVAARGKVARIINVEASVDGQPLTTYKADGVIVATATGSTGYSLAAGGPILNPRADEFLLVPILPHLGLGYSLVLPPEVVVELKIITSHRATLSIDGHISLPLGSGSVITVKHSLAKTRFLRIGDRGGFYSRLERKLKG
jgi:NAD+ kinase